MKSLHDLFEHGLTDVYAAEQQVLRQLQQMKQEAKAPELREAVEQHVRETEGQIRRLDKVFESLHLEKRTGTCATIQGLTEEKRQFMALGPAPPIVDVFNAEAALKTERYEITAYEGLLALAEQMGTEDVVEPLRQNLQEEERMLQRVMDARPLVLQAVATADKPAGGKVRTPT